jgi:hypothetical protein
MTKFGVILFLATSKVIKLSEKLSVLNFFSPQQEYELYRKSFLQSELGLIHQSIPWKSLIMDFKLKPSKVGRKPLFDNQGKLALMFLKSYTSLSDRKLIEQLNANIDYQLFCGVLLSPSERLDDFKIISKIRTQLAKKLNISSCQKTLSKHWKSYLTHTNVMLTDATCYESQLRYPTNVKLLWESVDWSYNQLKILCKSIRVRMPRNKYLEQKNKYYQYQRKRRKPRKDTAKRTRSLLYLLNKLNGLLNEIEDQYQERIELPEKYYQKRKVIRKVYWQQKQIFETGESLPNRIVSISKSYIRPIVRGKETKKVEFGAKVNMIQVDGINFIEHLSFDAFHEGNRLISSIWLNRMLFGKTSHISADAIYATNKNRKYCTSNGITTNFSRKGRAGKHEQHRKAISKELNIERATRMEGSFGTEKEHYGLRSVKARTQLNEVLWIFFGVHTANVVRIAKKMNANALEHKVA